LDLSHGFFFGSLAGSIFLVAAEPQWRESHTATVVMELFWMARVDGKADYEQEKRWISSQG